MELSQLHFHSMGIVTSNLDGNSKIITARLTEYSFGNNDELVNAPTESRKEYATRAGKDVLKTTRNNSVKATWMNTNSNRHTPPNVRRGDEVRILRVGNTDKYFWEDLGISNVKRLETVIYVFNADPNNATLEDLSNAYVLEWSTHNKTITITTSKANGEPVAYVAQLNAGDGVVSIGDDINNLIEMDSCDNIISLINAVGTKVILDKTNVSVVATDAVNFEANSFSVKADSYNVNVNSYSVSSSSVNIGASAIGLNGAVEVSGSLKVNGRRVKTE